MPRAVWKFDLSVRSNILTPALVPLNHRLVGVGWQGHTAAAIQLWCEVAVHENGAPLFPGEENPYEVYATGQKVPDIPPRLHVGFTQAGAFVWHVYRVCPQGRAR